MSKIKFYFLMIQFIIYSPFTSACTICNTETGRLVREGIFNHHFFINFIYTLIPFAIFTLIAIVTYFGLPLKLFKKKLTRRLDYDC